MWLDENWYKVSYEEIHIIYSSCGWYGHLVHYYTIILYLTLKKENTQLKVEDHGAMTKA